MANENNNLNVIASEERAKQSAASQPSLRVDVARNEAKAISSKEPKKLIPKLRFKEFEGEFNQYLFDELTDITRLAGYEYSQYWKEDEKEEIIALRGYNIGKGKLELKNLGYISNELSLKLKRSRLEKGDIVYPCVGTIGNAVVIEENDKFHIQQNIAKITCKDGVSPYFIVHFLTSDYGMKEVYKFNASGAQPNVLVGSLRKFKINLPNLPEQQKIANFLTAVDTKLQQLSTKKETLEQYKKGVMQQLFSQQLRFKPDVIANAVKQSHEANSTKQSATNENQTQFPDWEEKKLGELTEVIDSLHETPKEYVENGFAMIRVTDVNDKTLVIDDCLKVSEIVFNKFTKRYKPLKGDIIIARVGTCGASIILNTDEDVCLGQNTVLLRPKIDNIFLHFLIRSKVIQNQVNRNVVGSTQKTLSLKDLKRFNVSLPSIKEQQKIATYLSAIDKKIEAVQTQISNTQAFKKGLLQQMFV